MQDPILKYLKRNYWKGDPEGHSDAAKLGWEMRKLGFKPYQKKEPFLGEKKDQRAWVTEEKEIRIYKKRIYSGYPPPTWTYDPWWIDITNRKKGGTKRFGPFKSRKEVQKSVLPTVLLE